MRGKVLQSRRRYAFQRITPAYAGKSDGLFQNDLEQQDHPRLCGEKLTHTALPLDRLGSPPPMRGKVEWTGETATVNGITPAYAGKSIENNAEAKAL